VIAEPHDDIIEKMRLFVEQLENPKTVQDLRSNPPRVFEEDEHLVDCITHMKKNDYSQVVVHCDISYDLITREDIARWFEQQIENCELIITLEDKRIKDIFGINMKDEFRLLPKSATLLTLLDVFQQELREKIAAVLITEHGKNTEKPINIFTQWDFPDIYKEIEEY
jgi:predicted transcriptional regulator